MAAHASAAGRGWTRDITVLQGGCHRQVGRRWREGERRPTASGSWRLFRAFGEPTLHLNAKKCNRPPRTTPAHIRSTPAIVPPPSKRRGPSENGPPIYDLHVGTWELCQLLACAPAPSGTATIRFDPRSGALDLPITALPIGAGPSYEADITHLRSLGPTHRRKIRSIHRWAQPIGGWVHHFGFLASLRCHSPLPAGGSFGAGHQIRSLPDKAGLVPKPAAKM